MAAVAESNAVAALRTWNARLAALLDAHGVDAKVSFIRRWTPWYWRCRFPGKARCSSTRAACTAEHAGKTDVRIIDFVEPGHPALLRMWEKRQRGYRAMGYREAAKAISDDGASSANAGGSSTYQSWSSGFQVESI
jgi:hypothetical protein